VKNLDIAAVARQSGMSASALRFYEEKGLIRSIGRIGLRRVFDHRVLERLALISLGRAAGFSLDEMTGMFAADGKPRIDRRVLAAKADEIDKTIRKLNAIREGLRHAAVCRAPSHMECPKFQRILRKWGNSTFRSNNRVKRGAGTR
jgi:DNA-binding transcriptional MerR regulator